MNNCTCIYRKEIFCTILDVPECENVGCRFRKNSKEQIMKRRRVLDRIAQLHPEKQEHIAQKYYKGEMPWKEER